MPCKFFLIRCCGTAGDRVVTITVRFSYLALPTRSNSTQSHEGPRGCTIVTGSSLDGHSSIKVWTQEHKVSFSDRCLIWLMVDYLQSKDVSTASVAVALKPQTSITTKQLITFAIVCICINVLMSSLHLSSFTDILLDLYYEAVL